MIPEPGITFLGAAPQRIPDDLAHRFSPASHSLYEWQSYWARLDHAGELRVGDRFAESIGDGLFRIQLENQLGLCELQPYDQGEPVGEPLTVEVISPKFPSLVEHERFLSALLDELFSSAAGLPFRLESTAGRGVSEVAGRATPLFTLYFLLHGEHRLRSALRVVRERPQRELEDDPAYVPLHEASEVDAEVLISMALTQEDWTIARPTPLASRFAGHVPSKVWQRRSNETFDTVGNRFVRMFAAELEESMASLSDQPWWERVALDRQRRVLEIRGEMRDLVRSGLFDNVGAMAEPPGPSLLSREGYRELLELWRVFHSTQQPLFGWMEKAIALRQVDLLYETWVFFRLIEEIGSLSGLELEAIDLSLDDETGLKPGAAARFASGARLAYNRWFPTGRSGSYSVPLRPDFTWMPADQPTIALDAKFRMEPLPEPGDEEAASSARARHEDLYKMHAYRDALGMRAAVVLYPGNRSLFYHRGGRVENRLSLARLLRGGLEGVGALPLTPLVKTAAGDPFED